MQTIDTKSVGGFGTGEALVGNGGGFVRFLAVYMQRVLQSRHVAVRDRSDAHVLVLVHVDAEVRVERVEEASAHRLVEAPIELDRRGKQVKVGLDGLDTPLEPAVGTSELFFDASPFKGDVTESYFQLGGGQSVLGGKIKEAFFTARELLELRAERLGDFTLRCVAVAEQRAELVAVGLQVR